MVPASSIGVSPVVNPLAPNMLPDQLTRFGLTSDNSDKKNTRICNCKRSNCLKLYCECFASGAYCQPGTCNCNNCLNNVKNNDSRREAVDATLERNPNAFRSKIFITETDGGDTSTKHHKGCHCKKSYCLKKYCECYQGGVVCSEKCRCHDCRNYTGSTYLLEAVQKTQQKDPVEGETTNDSNNEEGNRGSSYIKTNSHLSRSVENSSGGEFLSDTTLQMICKSVQEEYNKGAKSAKKRPFSDTEENATATRSDINSSSASDDIRPSQSLKTIAVDSFSESLRGLLVSSLASTLSPDMVSGIVSLSLISPMKSQSLQSGGDIGTTLSLNNQAPQVHRPTSPSHQSHGDSLTQSQNENSDASSQCHTQVGEGQRTEGTQNSGNDASCSQNCGPSIAPLLSNSSGPSARSAIPESSIENMPSLLGKSSLTLEPTVSMQQMEAQATHWMKQQCKYSDLK